MSGPKTILALDLATKTGWAWGPAGTIKASGTINTRPNDGDTAETAFANITHFVLGQIKLSKPDMIVVEAALPSGQAMGQDAAFTAVGLYVSVSNLCRLYSTPLHKAQNNSVRAFYLGKGKAYAVVPPEFKPNLKNQKERSRQWAKKCVVERAIRLGHIPFGCTDNDRADACAVHAYASDRWGGAPAPAELVLFGERA